MHVLLGLCVCVCVVVVITQTRLVIEVGVFRVSSLFPPFNARALIGSSNATAVSVRPGIMLSRRLAERARCCVCLLSAVRRVGVWPEVS